MMWCYPLLVLIVVQHFAAIESRGATAWIYSCSSEPDVWGNIWNVIESTPAIDTVSLCVYRVTENGTFGMQDECGRLMSHMIPTYKAANPSLRQQPLIDAPSLSNLRAMWSDSDSRDAFIKSAIKEMTTLGFDGYNIDWEVSSESSKDTENFVRFLDEFGAAIRTATSSDATLSSDVAGSLALGNCTCNHCDYLNMSCANYTSTKIDHVVTMGTYTHDPDAFCRAVQDASTTALKTTYAPGLSLDTPDNVISRFFECASVVDRVYLWALDGRHAALTSAWNQSLETWTAHA